MLAPDVRPPARRQSVVAAITVVIATVDDAERTGPDAAAQRRTLVDDIAASARAILRARERTTNAGTSR